MELDVIITLIIIYCFGVGISSPADLTRMLNIHSLIAGLASGTYGFFKWSLALYAPHSVIWEIILIFQSLMSYWLPVLLRKFALTLLKE